MAKPGRKKVERINDEMKGAAIAAYQLTGSMTRAAELAGCARRTLNNEMLRDQRFHDAIKDAKAIFTDSLEDLALERIKDPKFKGSTVLLMQRLNAELPEKYKYRTETKVEGEIKVISAVPRPANDKDASPPSVPRSKNKAT